MTDISSTSEEADALRERLRSIEHQPLEERAVAFAELHDQLQSRLQGDDSQGPRG